MVRPDTTERVKYFQWFFIPVYDKLRLSKAGGALP